MPAQKGLLDRAREQTDIAVRASLVPGVEVEFQEDLTCFDDNFCDGYCSPAPKMNHKLPIYLSTPRMLLY